jgi:hypothetical protein
MPGHHNLHRSRASAASLVDAATRASAFATLRPALDALATQAGTDPHLGIDARRVLRAITGTRPQDTLTLAGLATRASTPKARIPYALNELHTYGYLARVAEIAPHLNAALPALDTTTLTVAPPTPEGAEVAERTPAGLWQRPV